MSLPPGRRGRSYSVRMLAISRQQGSHALAKVQSGSFSANSTDPTSTSSSAKHNFTFTIRLSCLSSHPEPNNFNLRSRIWTPTRLATSVPTTASLRICVSGKVLGYIDHGILYQAKSPAGEDGGWIHVLAWRPTHDSRGNANFCIRLVWWSTQAFAG